MSLADLIALIAAHPLVVIAVLLTPPLLIAVFGLIHGRGAGRSAPWPLLYSVLLQLACVPGMFAIVLVGYALFFLQSNLLELNLVVYVMPIVAMLATLFLVRRQVGFEHLPGVDRLWASLTLLGLSFTVALAIQKLRILVFFGGSIAQLLLLALGAYLLGRWALRVMLRSPR